MPEVILWQQADPNAVLDRALAVLADGAVVAVPTEAGYELLCSAEQAKAMARLSELARAHATDSSPVGLALALAFAGQLLDWVPGICRVGMRFARRGWPGPLILVNQEGRDAGLAGRLPPETRCLLPERLAFRAPDHDVPYVLARYSPTPLMLARTALASPRKLAEQLGDQLDLLVEDGECANRTATVVEVAGDSWQVLYDGALSANDLRKMTACRILFVCTGNTCRSPLAEALCAKLLAERLGCGTDELSERGYVVASAGLGAYPGKPATAEAVQAARDLGADLSHHQSRPLTAELLLHADHVVAMTRGHLEVLSVYNVPGGTRPRLLSADGLDIADPIGSSAEVYRDCARDILRHLEKLLPELET